MIQFGYTIFYVKDVLNTADFYIAAFGFELAVSTPDGAYAALNTGTTTLAFCEIDFAAKNIGSEFIVGGAGLMPMEIGFVVDDVMRAYQHALLHGAMSVLPPTTKPWGQIVSYLKDPNGFLIEICSAIA